MLGLQHAVGDPTAAPTCILQPMRVAGFWIRHWAFVLYWTLRQPVTCCVYVHAVEEAIIALVRLYQSYTFELADKLKSGPLQVKQALTVSPKDGIPVTVVHRKILH